MEKIWLNAYPPGVPSVIDPDLYRNLDALFQETVRKHGDRPAFYLLGHTITFTELDQYSRSLAAFFQQRMKLQKGDRLAIMLPNLLQYPVVMLAALRIGVIVVNVNPLYTASELSFQLNDAGAKAIVILSQVAQTLEKAWPELCIKPAIMMTNVFDLHPAIKRSYMQFALKYFYPIPAYQLPKTTAFRYALKKGSTLSPLPVMVDATDIAFLQYTGGTTGISKGAMLTHRNILANIEQVDAWFGHSIQYGKEVIITALPLYHIFSLLANCLFFMKNGGLNVLILNPRNIKSMVKEMKKFKFTAITGVNTLFAALLKNDDFKSLDFSHLHFAFGGGMALQKSTAEAWQAATHFPLLEGYGLTEASPVVTANPLNLKTYNGTIGLPLPSTEVAILDHDGHEMPIDTIGELAIKGPQVMQGYFNHDEETRKSFTSDGWFLTGDMASIDRAGFVKIVERKKEMILVSGFNVYPLEIEEVITMLPKVAECAVVGVPSEQTGETVKAFIVKKDQTLTKEEVKQHCREHLTHYKLPKLIEFIDTLPKSAIGKVLRRKLKGDSR